MHLVRVRLDQSDFRLAACLSRVREDGQKVLLAIKSMGGEAARPGARSRRFINRGLRRPEFLIVDGAPVSTRRLLPCGRRAGPAMHGPQAQEPSGHAPERLHDEVTADYTDISTRRPQRRSSRRNLIRKWRLKHRAIAESLEEAGDRLFTFAGYREPMA